MWPPILPCHGTNARYAQQDDTQNMDVLLSTVKVDLAKLKPQIERLLIDVKQDPDRSR